MRFLLLLTLLLPVSVEAQRRTRVAFVGDSHMQMLGPRLVPQFRAAGFRPVGVIARQGWSTRRYQLADDLADELRPLRPDIVVVQLGSNDYGVRRASRYRIRVQWVVDAVRRAGASRIIWLGPPAADPEAVPVVAAVHDLVAGMQQEVLPSMQVTWLDSRPVTRDFIRRGGYHMTRSGYTAWAREVVRLTRAPP